MFNCQFFQIQKFDIPNSLESFLLKKGIKENQIEKLSKKKLICVNEKTASLNDELKFNQRIQIFSNESEKKNYLQFNSLQIIHCDDDFLVVNKPYGIVVHPDHHHFQDNVMSFLQKWLNFSKSEFENLSPIVHRLDKPTTGLFLLARNLESANILRTQLKKRLIKRKYLALAQGIFTKDKFTIDAPLIKPGKQKQAVVSYAGKTARTHINVLQQKKEFALIECELETGRTHQIRSHLKLIGHPLLNDSLYGKNKSEFLFLHSYKIKFVFFKSKFLKAKKFHFEISYPSFFTEKLSN